MEAEMKVIVFELNGEEYAISVDCVKSIEKLLHITRVPNTQSYIRGVINLRGIVTPIIDLRNRLDFPEHDYDESTRIIITSLSGLEVGIIVDAANDVVNINSENIEAKPEIIGVESKVYISGVVKQDNRLIILLDVTKILDKDEILK